MASEYFWSDPAVSNIILALRAQEWTEERCDCDSDKLRTLYQESFRRRTVWRVCENCECFWVHKTD